jgi:hypothetical protein
LAQDHGRPEHDPPRPRHRYRQPDPLPGHQDHHVRIPHRSSPRVSGDQRVPLGSCRRSVGVESNLGDSCDREDGPVFRHLGDLYVVANPDCVDEELSGVDRPTVLVSLALHRQGPAFVL